jgi:tetratricopeptide (TPR) repeat protein
MDAKKKEGSPKMARVMTTQEGFQKGSIRTRFILNLVEEGSKEVKKTATLSILMLALMLTIMVLANGCAHRQTLQRCVERHGQPARVVEGEGGMVTWYYYYPGRSGNTIVLEVVGNSTTGLISQIKKYPVTQNAGLPKDTKQPSPPSGGTLKRTSPTTKQNAPSDARAEAPSGRKASGAMPNAPSAVRAGLSSAVSPPSGLYSLDALTGFDTLDGVSYNPAQGTLSLFGHRTRSDRKADMHYLDLLAAAIDSNKPVFSLEWTPSSQREVDRAMAFYADDRNNDTLTTRLSKIFDANGRLNRKGASFFKALGVNAREGMNRYEFNASLLAASGRPNAGNALRAFGGMVEAVKHNDQAAKKNSVEDLVNALGLYDFISENAARYRNKQITEAQLMDLVWPRILSGLANAFGWDDRKYVDKYWRLRRSGRPYDQANDEALWDLQNDLNTLPRKALDAIMANKSEIVVPPDVMRDVLGAEPRVRPVLTGLPDRTRLALTACEADAFCKALFDMPGLQAKVPRYKGYFAWLRERSQRPVTGDGHLWISPGNFELFESADGRTLRFGRTPMKINIEKYESGRRSVANPQLTAYADLLTACYDDIAREYPVLHQLRECTKMVAVAQWLKRRGHTVSLPRAGREVVNLPAELPGVMYMVMAVKQGPVGEILTAAGGVDFSGDNGWKYTPRDTAFPQEDLVDRTGRQIREKLQQISGRKIEAPMPRPMAGIKTEEIGTQKVTTVTVATGAGAEGSAPAVRLQRSPEQDAVLLWKADDLTGAEMALRKLIESAGGDVRYAASLHAWLAQILHEKGDDAGAIKELNEAARLAPDLPIFQLLRAKSMVESGDLAGAQAALLNSLELDPKNQGAARLLADVQARQKGGAGAPAVPLTAFPKAIEGVPTPATQVGSAGAAPSAGTAGGRTALDQAHTNRESASQGLRSQTPEGQITGQNEDASGAARQVFDNPAPLQSSEIKPAVDLRNVGKAPELPAFVRSDKEIIRMQKDRDAFLATQQKKDAELTQIRKQIEAETNSTTKGDLMVKAAQLKAESSQAEYEATLKNKEIEKRAKLLIDTHVEESLPEPGDQKTPPPDGPKTGE